MSYSDDSMSSEGDVDDHRCTFEDGKTSQPIYSTAIFIAVPI
jgi:hypothetical protein